MMPLFADTSFFVAFLSPDDENHAPAVEYMETYPEQMVTTQWVLAELGNFLSKVPARRLFTPFIRRLQDEQLIVIVKADDEDFQGALELFGRRPDKDWSFIDCTSFVVMTRQRMSHALTADHHFEQAGFTVLLSNV